MDESPRKPKVAGFRPINTIESAVQPTFASSTSHDMVNEREPPRSFYSDRYSSSPLMDITNGPEFGKSSPMRNPLKDDRANIFHKPKAYNARPEHHRPPPSNSSVSPNLVSSNTSSYQQPLYQAKPPGTNGAAGSHKTQSVSPGFYEIPKPTHFPQPSLPRPQQPFFFTGQAPSSNAWKTTIPPKPIDLTGRNDDGFNPDQALGLDKYGGYDPSNYLDSAQTNENIKALLEGAFDDEDDKSKTRLRNRNKKDEAAAAALTGKMNALKVDGGKKEEVENQDEEDDGTVDGLNIKLLPHQIDGVAWMLDKEVGTRKKNGVLPKGGILADDMGLGKTIQALSLILTNRRPSADDLAENPKLKVPEAAGKGTLIVAPLALIKQWDGEIKSKVDVFPKLKVLVHHGPSRTKSFEALKKYDIVITTYQTLTSEHSDTSDNLAVGCFGVHWYRIILDEAHSIKNRNAKMTKAAYDLKSVYRWCLTGTPMQNNLDELQSLIRFLRIKPYCEMSSWKEQISQPMKNGRGGLAMKRLQYFLRAFMKRRTKEVLKKEGALNFGKPGAAAAEGKTQGFKIVARNVQTVVADFNEAEREFYSSLEARTEKNLAAMMGTSKNDYIGALVLLLRLRQTCNHPELIKGNLKKEKESLTSASQQPGETPRKPKSSGANDLDDIADMFGGLTVETKTCDSCGSKLDKGEVAGGAVRCADCKYDMQKLQQQSRESRSKKPHDHHKKRPVPEKQPARKLHNRRVVDSDDEEDDGGEWLVRKTEQGPNKLGKAGGKEDEDVEGGGRWLGDDDSDSEEEGDSMNSMDQEADEASSIDDSASDSTSSSSTPPQNQRLIPSTKIRRLLEILSSETPTHKFIVFSEFTSMLDIIEPFLRLANLSFTRYDGSMKNDDREASLDRLRNDPRTRILLCSLRCGSLGLNLTAASRVVILEPFWNPFVEEQAIDRVHRLNQTQDVTVYRLTIANTVEERILELQEKKRELANAAIEGGKAVGKLNMQDILKLFKHDAVHDQRFGDGAGLALASGKPAGLLGSSPVKRPETSTASSFTFRSSPPASGAQARPPSKPQPPHNPAFRLPTHNRPAMQQQQQQPNAEPRKFIIPKSLQRDYEAYKKRDVGNE